MMRNLYKHFKENAFGRRELVALIIGRDVSQTHITAAELTYVVDSMHYSGMIRSEILRDMENMRRNVLHQSAFVNSSKGFTGFLAFGSSSNWGPCIEYHISCQKYIRKWAEVSGRTLIQYMPFTQGAIWALTDELAISVTAKAWKVEDSMLDVEDEEIHTGYGRPFIQSRQGNSRRSRVGLLVQVVSHIEAEQKLRWKTPSESETWNRHIGGREMSAHGPEDRGRILWVLRR